MSEVCITDFRLSSMLYWQKKDFKKPMTYTSDSIRNILLTYYDEHRRDLPWRQVRTPYGTWISETMLQQTRVATVIPYYHRFLEEFPDLRTLAEAPTDRVYKVWEGLGYYSRARNLQNGARFVLEHENGVLPDDADRLRKIPGIGPYTAGAIASLAFGKAEAAVDGNVIRVFSRLYAMRISAKDESSKRLIAEKVRLSLPEDRPGDFNEAIMDVGAGICLPKRPLCAECPLQTVCQANLLGIQNELPLRTPKNPNPEYPKTVVVCFQDDKVLLHRRPATGLLANLYEFLTLDGHLSEEDVINETVRAVGLSPANCNVTVSQLAPSRHVFSHLTWVMEAFRVEFARKKTGPEILFSECRPDYLFVDREAASLLAFPSALKAYVPEILPKSED